MSPAVILRQGTCTVKLNTEHAAPGAGSLVSIPPCGTWREGGTGLGIHHPFVVVLPAACPWFKPSPHCAKHALFSTSPTTSQKSVLIHCVRGIGAASRS